MVNEFQNMINLLKLVDEQHRLEGEDENEYSRSILAEVIGMLQKCEQCNVSGALPPSDEEITKALNAALKLKNADIDDSVKLVWIEGAQWMRDLMLGRQ